MSLRTSDNSFHSYEDIGLAIWAPCKVDYVPWNGWSLGLRLHLRIRTITFGLPHDRQQADPVIDRSRNGPESDVEIRTVIGVQVGLAEHGLDFLTMVRVKPIKIPNRQF